MLFNSIQFLIFLPIVLGAYFVLPHRFRWMLLLVASYYFYMCWKAEYLLLILLTSAITFFTAFGIGKEEVSTKKRKGLLILSFVSNLLVLFTFKYFNFFSTSLERMASALGMVYLAPHLNVLLPVGISFYTFQALSYTMDVYRRDIKPEHHFGRYALFVSFFPQLVAGPIERTPHLLPQFSEQHFFDERRLVSGFRLMLWGFFKKIVVADRLAILVNAVYNDVESHTGAGFFIATLFFAFQIYCDFSAYSDIAIGVARMFGFDLMTNFRRPYFSQSITEFWRRWHISLSTWFRDYLYIPLGGSRCKRGRFYTNLLIVFLVSGLWHGAAWTFVIWGGMHGICMIIEHMFGLSAKMASRPLIRFFRMGITFGVVFLTWIFFRANTWEDSCYIIRSLLNIHEWGIGTYILRTRELLALSRYELVIAFLGIVVLLVVDWLKEKNISIASMLPKYQLLRWAVYATSIISLLFFAEFGSQQFIYFQF